MKTHDNSTPPRRLRMARVSTGKRKHLSDRQIEWLLALHRHRGPLSSKFLHAFTADRYPSEQGTRRNLCDLYNEENTPEGGPYLERPFQQFDTIDARYQDLVYDLAPAGVQALKDRGLWSDYAPPQTGSWKHRYMVSAITASIELGSRRRGWRFIAGHELLERAKTTLELPVPYEWDGEEKTGILAPDALCAIDYGGKYRAFVIEADRATEPKRAKTHARKSFKKNVLQYRNLIGGGLYKEHYGLNCGMVCLNITVGDPHMQAMKKCLEDTCNKNSYIAFSYIEEMGRHWKPVDVLYDHFEGPWQLVGYPGFRITDI